MISRCFPSRHAEAKACISPEEDEDDFDKVAHALFFAVMEKIKSSPNGWASPFNQTWSFAFSGVHSKSKSIWTCQPLKAKETTIFTHD